MTNVQLEALAKQIHNAWNSLQGIAQEVHGLSDDDWDEFHRFKLNGEEIEHEIRRVEDRTRLLRSRFEGKGRW